jgi:hypothetical protein
VAACIAELHTLGYAQAVVIGAAEPRSAEPAPIRVLA